MTNCAPRLQDFRTLPIEQFLDTYETTMPVTVPHLVAAAH